MKKQSYSNIFFNTKILDYAILGLISMLYAPIILHWCDGWLNKSIGVEHEYFSHGLLGFPFAAYIVWENRTKWHKLPDNSHPLGGILLLLGAICYFTGVPELVNISFPMVLGGLCLWLKGWEGLKLQGFPMLLVVLATPNSIPYLITPHTLWLQKFIAGVAGFILLQLGMDVSVEGIYIFVQGRTVEVAPYCAGLKMLFTSLYAALMLLYWTENIRDRQKTILLLVGSVITSVSANIVRNTILSFFHGTGRDRLFVWLHDSWGGDVYLAIMLGFIVLLLQQIEKIKTVNHKNIENEEYEYSQINEENSEQL